MKATIVTLLIYFCCFSCNIFAQTTADERIQAILSRFQKGISGITETQLKDIRANFTPLIHELTAKEAKLNKEELRAERNAYSARMMEALQVILTPTQFEEYKSKYGEFIFQQKIAKAPSRNPSRN
ncbi:MAG: hypothetical protein NZ108_07555 [Bacteroidia bacterium]|nr:hypothetical protein [Bacteroidia bacterium]